MNLFTFYNLPVSFSPSKTLVKQQYFKLSRQYHPDFFEKESDTKKAKYLQLSAEVNNGYKIFSDQSATIKYVLELKGLMQDTDKYKLPNSFLMEMMELNETLLEAQMDDNEHQKAIITNSIQLIQQSIYQDVKLFIESENIDNLTDEQLLLVKDFYFKKKYLTRILDNIN
jgi:molecular chaperone HscB